MNELDAVGNRTLVASRDRLDMQVDGALWRSWRFAPGGAIVVTDQDDPFARDATRRVFRCRALGEVEPGWDGSVPRLNSDRGSRGGGAVWHEVIAARIFSEDTVVVVVRAWFAFHRAESAWWFSGWDLWGSCVPTYTRGWETFVPRPREVRGARVRWSDKKWREGMTDSEVEGGNLV